MLLLCRGTLVIKDMSISLKIRTKLALTTGSKFELSSVVTSYFDYELTSWIKLMCADAQAKSGEII